jgi:hypothetical protein
VREIGRLVTAAGVVVRQLTLAPSVLTASVSGGNSTVATGATSSEILHPDGTVLSVASSGVTITTSPSGARTISGGGASETRRVVVVSHEEVDVVSSQAVLVCETGTRLTRPAPGVTLVEFPDGTRVTTRVPAAADAPAETTVECVGFPRVVRRATGETSVALSDVTVVTRSPEGTALVFHTHEPDHHRTVDLV